ncbi:DUF7532 family protein [Halegenticoccus soli]|uniref:DUF7532 family protein n=1 Tax=Halegenticoccus soli TaxID=1985678 RepID=UPI000C6DEC22|nr:hypothetical protein [Halegenticoccus soli]
MHFDPRTQRALREVGLDQDDLRAASSLVAEAVREEAEALEAFFGGTDSSGPPEAASGDGGGRAFYSDMEMAHSKSDVQEHRVAYLDLYTHGGSLRGYLRFDTWGAYVEDGRVLNGDVVELTLGPTVHDRVRFARDPEALDGGGPSQSDDR